jgi:hypothetical protein
MSEAEVQEHEGVDEVATEREALEARAREMGWVPKEEFRGDHSKWTSAEDYVRRGENMIPLLRAESRRNAEESRRLREELAEAGKKINEMSDVMAEFREYAKSDRERAYRQAMRELEERQTAAVAVGDTAVFQETKAQMAELERERAPRAASAAPAPPPAPATPPPVPDMPEVRAWVAKEARWFHTDPDANAFASALDTRLMRDEPELPVIDRLAKVKAAVKKRFPEHFENQRREDAASVGFPSGSEPPARKSGKKTYADLPAEAKKQCDKFVKDKLLTPDQYVRDYDWS